MLARTFYIARRYLSCKDAISIARNGALSCKNCFANLAKLYSCKVTLILHVSCLSYIYLASKCKGVLPGCAYLMHEIDFNTRITEPYQSTILMGCNMCS